MLVRTDARELSASQGDISLGPEVVDGDDLGMIERGDGVRFVHEAGLAIAVGRHVRSQHLERDVAPQPRIVGPVDGAHAALAQHGDQLVGADATSWSECHGDAR
jgi:hypothetical protein